LARIKSGDTVKLHYALTDSECNACGSHLKWQPDFDDIGRPKYVSHHCNYQYIIYIDDVKFDVVEKESAQHKNGQEPVQTERERKEEPRAILIARKKKEEQQKDRES
jgi:hypothetical protein